jgi:hypothetical protein
VALELKLLDNYSLEPEPEVLHRNKEPPNTGKNMKYYQAWGVAALCIFYVASLFELGYYFAT